MVGGKISFMKVIMWMGMSLNGYIAGEDNNEDFISHDCWVSWLEAIRQHGCIIWGRKTYQVVKTWPQAYFNDIQGDKNRYCLTQTKDFKVDSGFQLAHSPKRPWKS